jgi:hypothetical protein
VGLSVIEVARNKTNLKRKDEKPKRTLPAVHQSTERTSIIVILNCPLAVKDRASQNECRFFTSFRMTEATE